MRRFTQKPASQFLGEVAILFASRENRPAVRLRAGGIVRVDQIFDPLPDSLVAMRQWQASELVPAPVSR